MSGELLAAFFLLVGVTVMVVGGFYVQKQLLQRRHAAWSGLAERHGWSLTATPRFFPMEAPSLLVQGASHGRPFSVHTEARCGGRYRYEVTVARLELGDEARRRG
ncbi:hypothetical protein [Pyxidicoccus caerfyrddinensis]|uniref:hypothetical protein n=1 Tax=Pyxidicoccus caerfyrddinensis TaxID=2709663 RepID=UPI0013DBEB8D|nr:hypothetical protein [Pyxidicoccus caerfyrddinensis]